MVKYGKKLFYKNFTYCKKKSIMIIYEQKEIVMNNQFNEESLQKLGIFELRNLAREVGVYSPTIYKKQEIIDKILEIVTGKKEPYIAKTKQGRPPKSINSVNNILDIFIPKNAIANSYEKYNSSYDELINTSRLVAMEKNANNSYNAHTENLVKGVLEVSESGYGFCYLERCQSKNQMHNFFLSNTIIEKYGLRTGDFLEGYVKKLAEDKPLIMYKIKSVNKIEVDNFNKKRKAFNSSQAHYPIKKIKLDESKLSVNRLFLNRFLPIGYGQRAIVILPKNTDYSSLITNYLNSILKSDNIYKKCILTDERPEDVTEYFQNLIDTSIIYTNVEEICTQATQKIELYIERAKRRVEEGSDVILFISNLNRLQNLYKKQLAVNGSSTSSQDEINSLTMVKKLLSSARRTSDMGTLTIIGIVEENGNPDFITSLKEICNMQFLLNEKAYLNSDKIWANILKSETRKANLLLTPEEYEFVNNFKKNLTKENLEEKTLELEKYLLNKAK
jgi:transcription termination factor Rho